MSAGNPDRDEAYAALATLSDAIFVLMEERARCRAVLALVLASSSPPVVQARAREALEPLTREQIDAARTESGAAPWPWSRS